MASGEWGGTLFNQVKGIDTIKSSVQDDNNQYADSLDFERLSDQLSAFLLPTVSSIICSYDGYLVPF